MPAVSIAPACIRIASIGYGKRRGTLTWRLVGFADEHTSNWNRRRDNQLIVDVWQRKSTTFIIPAMPELAQSNSGSKSEPCVGDAARRRDRLSIREGRVRFPPPTFMSDPRDDYLPCRLAAAEKGWEETLRALREARQTIKELRQRETALLRRSGGFAVIPMDELDLDKHYTVLATCIDDGGERAIRLELIPRDAA